MSIYLYIDNVSKNLPLTLIVLEISQQEYKISIPLALNNKYGFNPLRNEGWRGKCQGVGLRRGNRVFYLYKIQLKLMLTIHFNYKSIENYLPLSNFLIRAGCLYQETYQIFLTIQGNAKSACEHKHCKVFVGQNIVTITDT